VSEGYTQAELDSGLFDKDVATLLVALLKTPPFNDADVRPVLNVVKVATPSANTGNTIKLLTPAPATSPFNTAFGAMFGRDTFNGCQIKRALYGDSAAVQALVRAQSGLAPVNNFLVIVNNTDLYGGISRDGVAWFSKQPPDWPAGAIHELGHQAFDLADEYPYRIHHDTDPVRTYSGLEANQPNVTTATTVSWMKWGGLVKLPQSLVPSTVPSSPCVRDHTVQPGVPAGAIGAFEGAGHFDCGIFRPALTCKMRDYPQPFCQVCEVAGRWNLGHYMLKQGLSTTLAVGAWTHMQTFLSGTHPRTLAYNASTGAYSIFDNVSFSNGGVRRLDGTPPLDETNPSLGTGSIGLDWTCLVPFTLSGALHYFAHSFGSGQQAMFEVNATGDTLTSTWSSPPGTTWTHVVTLDLVGKPHYLGYNSLTGDAGLFRIDSNTIDPTPVTTMQLGMGQSAVVSVPAGGDPLVLTYRIVTGEVQIRRITTAGFTMTFASASNFWATNKTHVAPLDLGGRSYVLRYSGLDGSGTIDHIRAGGTGVDFVSQLDPAPGLGGLYVLGTGAPALGKCTIPTNAGGFSDNAFFYSALRQSIRIWPLN
jgi:hypothetical protein